jgi:hypothetical protein
MSPKRLAKSVCQVTGSSLNLSQKRHGSRLFALRGRDAVILLSDVHYSKFLSSEKKERRFSEHGFD